MAKENVKEIEEVTEVSTEEVVEVTEEKKPSFKEKHPTLCKIGKIAGVGVAGFFAGVGLSKLFGKKSTPVVDMGIFDDPDLIPVELPEIKEF